MKVKGMAYLSRKEQIINEFGQARWDDFETKFSNSHPNFEVVILPSSLMSIDNFMQFQEAIVKEFYNGDEKIYWKFGEHSAEYAMSEKGPYSIYLAKSKTEDKKHFLTQVLPRIWHRYYDEGKTVNELKMNKLHSYVLDLPVYYSYFEYSVMGFTKKVLELINIKVKEIKKIKSSAEEIYYIYTLEL
jgi:hypothetical protein